MKIDILTLFPEMFTGPLEESILGRAREKEIVQIDIRDLREYTQGRHRKADDRPYGGGPGMVMKPEPIFEAVKHLTRGDSPRKTTASCARVIFLSPQGEVFTQDKAQELAGEKHLIFICGHYEGIDERAVRKLATDEISIGDYVLTGGELPAMVVTDALVRLLPGVLGGENSAKQDSFSKEIFDCPHYTRPALYRQEKVPEVLLSGNHEEIEKWRRREALRKTFLKRPDLINKAELTQEDKDFLDKCSQDEGDFGK